MDTQNFVSRVNQLDALQLDKEIIRILREGIIDSFKNLAPSLLVKYQPEINLLLDSTLWCLSIAKNLSTFGQRILLISYNKNKATISRLTLHFLLSILPKYIKDITEQKFTKYELLQKTIDFCQHLYILLSIINFFRFLKTGKYPTLLDFILRWDLITHEPSKYRRVGYDYMTRELIWAGFMEFLGTVLPLINYHKLRNFIKTTIFFPFNIKSSLSTTTTTTTTVAIKTPNQILNVAKQNFSTRTTCCICNERPTHPHIVNCGHIFCYYCIYENYKLDSNYCCPICDIKVENIIRIKFES